MTRVASMGELAASIAHQINQPLAAIVLNESASLRWLTMQPPNLDEARDAVVRAIKEANRAGDVIARVRALLQKAPPQIGWLDLNEIIREVLALTASELRDGVVTIDTELAADLPAARGDRVQLQQVVLNLIMNAVEAMSTGSRASETADQIGATPRGSGDSDSGFWNRPWSRAGGVASSSHSLPLNPRASAWDCPLHVPWLSPTGDVCGLPPGPPRG